MNKKEITEILVYLHADSETPLTEGKVAVWLDQFQAVSKQAGWLAARYLVTTRKGYGSHKAFDFAEALRNVSSGNGGEISGVEAFNLAYKAVGRFGRYRQAEALASLPALVSKALQAFGFEEIGQCESPDLIRGNFAKLFDSMNQRERMDSTLAPGIRNDIKALRDSEKLGIEAPKMETQAGQLLQMCNIKAVA